MAVNVTLPETLAESARHCGAIDRCPVPKQIESRPRIGGIAAENPDLPFSRALPS